MSIRRFRQLLGAVLLAAAPIVSLATVVYFDWSEHLAPLPQGEPFVDFGGNGYVAFDVPGADLRTFSLAPMVDFRFELPDGPVYTFSDMAPGAGSAIDGLAFFPGFPDFQTGTVGNTQIIVAGISGPPPRGVPWVICTTKPSTFEIGLCGLPLRTGALYAGDWVLRPAISVPTPGIVLLLVGGLVAGAAGMRTLRWLLN